MSEATHPGHAAINLHAQYEAHKNAAIQKRASAADMRRRAKACALKADAFALKAQAKPISAEAAQSTSSASKALSEFLGVAAQTQQLLSMRMPPEWQRWGVTKTRAYTNTLTLLSVQLTRKHPKPAVVANAIQHLLSHSSWQERTLQILLCATPSTKELPLS